MLGRVVEIGTDKATGFYNLKLRSIVDFGSIQQVFIVENLERAEQLTLEKETEKKMNQGKGGKL
jgi:rod shape-determining protein MreC